MPIIDTKPSKPDAPAISEQNALDLTAMSDDLADIYSENLKAAEGGLMSTALTVVIGIVLLF